LERVVEEIPTSLRDNLSKKLIDIILDASAKDAVPAEMAKRIIYLWRQDQLSTPAGLKALVEAALMVSPEGTYAAFNELGLQKVAAEIRGMA